MRVFADKFVGCCDVENAAKPDDLCFIGGESGADQQLRRCSDFHSRYRTIFKLVLDELGQHIVVVWRHSVSNESDRLY